MDLEDDFPRSVAALRRYDVLFINPIRDGLNLVTLEGPLVNERDGQLVVSREAGVWDQVGHVAHGVNPYDIAEQARVLAVALDSSPEDRARPISRNRPSASLSAKVPWTR